MSQKFTDFISYLNADVLVLKLYTVSFVCVMLTINLDIAPCGLIPTYGHSERANSYSTVLDLLAFFQTVIAKQSLKYNRHTMQCATYTRIQEV